MNRVAPLTPLLRYGIAAVSLLAISLTGCGWGGTLRVDTPTFSPAPGNYSSSQTVTISDGTPHSTIYFTTDGTDPTRSSTRYTGAITVSTNETIKAFAVENSYADSAIAVAIYNVVPPTATPQLTPPPGIYVGSVVVTITDSTPGAVIYYTTDASTPTTSSPVYTAPVTVYTTGFIRAVALAPGHTLSDVVTGKYDISNGVDNIWTWMAGGTNGSATSIYGTQGVPDPANTPSGRTFAMTWVDANGNFWLYGGKLPLFIGTSGFMGDMWEFSPTTAEWTWQGGSQTAAAPPVYGTLGVAAASNMPGARYSSATWTDKAGNLWLFGGYGAGTSGPNGNHNDLWMFNTSTLLWTWVGGSSSTGLPGNYGVKGVPAATNIPDPESAFVTGTDSSGNFWFLGTAKDGYFQELWEYNPVSQLWTWVNEIKDAPGIFGTKGIAAPGNLPPGGDLFVGGMNQRNELLIFGGYVTPGLITDTTWQFDLSSSWWTWEAGSNTPGASLNPGTMGVPAPANTPGSRYQDSAWIDNDGNLWVFGGYRSSGAAYFTSNDLWKFNTITHEWTWVDNDLGFDELGVYGTRGIPSPTNMPGGRLNAATWTAKDGTLWLFGGNGWGDRLPIPSTTVQLNDMWRYQP